MKKEIKFSEIEKKGNFYICKMYVDGKFILELKEKEIYLLEAKQKDIIKYNNK